MFQNINLVFGIYGGISALFHSIYVRISILVTAIAWRSSFSELWVKYSVSILPNIIGFSIAAIAIITVIGDDGFRRRMSQVNTLHDEESDLTVMLASFVWFILIQITAILFAIIFSSKPFPFSCNLWGNNCITWNYYVNLSFSFVGMFLFIYSLSLVIASVFMTFHLFRIYIRNAV